MLHLLRLEWLKQRNYVLFKILAFAYIVFLPGLLMVGKTIPASKQGGMTFNPKILIFRFPNVWEFLGYTGNWLMFFILGFLGVVLATNEHTYRTLRQNIITGLQRHEFFWSKIQFITVAALAATLYYALCAIVIGLIHSTAPTFADVFYRWDLIPRYFLQAMGYMSFGLLIGTLVRRTGLALFLYLGYVFFLEPVLRWVVHLKIAENKYMKYYPMNAIEDLTPLPEMLTKMAMTGFEERYKFSLYLSSTEAVWLSLGYILLFLALTYRRIVRSDL